MKKIVAAASLAALAASAAFADVKITLNNRIKLDAFATTTTDNDGTKATTTAWMDWEGYDQAWQGSTRTSDGFKFAFNADNCGVTLNLNTGASESAPFVLNEFSAWAKWALPVGSLKIDAGQWKDGYADGAYRVKKDVDAQNAEGMDFERFKLGSILKGNKGAFVDDLTNGNGNKAYSGFATYSVAATDDITINATIGGNYSVFDTIEDKDDPKDTTTTYYDSTFVGRLQVNVADLFNSEIIYKKLAPRYNTFGLFVKPVLVDGLDATVGFSMDTYAGKGGEKDNGGYTDMAFDLRARYAVSPEFSITTFHNISMTDLDDGRAISASVVGHKGDESLVKGVKAKTAMWNNISGRYKINDTISATLNVGLVTPLSIGDTDDKAKNDASVAWRVTPAVQVYAASNASVWCGVAISGQSGKLADKDQSTMAVQVPVIFRVKM